MAQYSIDIYNIPADISKPKKKYAKGIIYTYKIINVK